MSNPNTDIAIVDIVVLERKVPAGGLPGIYD
jgi:hypothetical protein